MAFRPESRWWIVTLFIIAILVGISALALDRPNVVWQNETPHCPACRVEVQAYSTKCPSCRAEFDWVVAADDASPISPYSLSAIEAEALRKTVKALGEPEAIKRIVQHAGFTEAGAKAYLDRLGRGRCGACGGAGVDPTMEPGAPGDHKCEICQGEGASVSCGGDRRQVLGVWAAERDLGQYLRELKALRASRVAPDIEMEEAWRLAHAFLARHAGTVQTREVLVPFLERGVVRYQPAAARARARLDSVLRALNTEL